MKLTKVKANLTVSTNFKPPNTTLAQLYSPTVKTIPDDLFAQTDTTYFTLTKSLARAESKEKIIPNTTLSSFRTLDSQSSNINITHRIKKNNHILIRTNTKFLPNECGVNVSIEDPSVELESYNNEIKRLDRWDTEHSIKGNLSKCKSDVTKSQTTLKSLARRMTNLDVKKLKKKIDDGVSILPPNAYSEEDVDNVILKQNISLAANKFNFDIFFEKVNPTVTVYSDQEKYRQIMKEKLLNEICERNILYEISMKIYERKIERNNINTEINNLTLKLDKIKTEYFYKKDTFTFEIKQIDKIFLEVVDPGIKNVLNTVSPKTTSFSNANLSFSSNKSTPMIKKGTFDETNAFRLRMEWVRLINLKEQEIQLLTLSYYNKKVSFQKQIERHNYRLVEIGSELKQLTVMLNEKIILNRNYFTRILTKGIDCRTDGLSWCVRKLLEVDTLLDYTMFPKFLDHSQIDYLIQLGQLQTQATYLRSMLRILKQRQIKLREDDGSFGNVFGSNFMVSSDDGQNLITPMTLNILFFGDSNFKVDEQNPNVNAAKFNENIFSKRLMNNFQKVFKKFANLMKSTFENRIEEIKTYTMVKELKGKLKSDRQTGLKRMPSEKVIKNVVHKYLDGMGEKGYLQDILEIRQMIKDNEEEIAQLIENQRKVFDSHYESTKYYNVSKTINYDLLFKALFGNGIAI